MVRFKFTGTGGALFVKFFVGMLLSMVTLGIYLPWFMVSLTRYVCDNTVLETGAGAVRLKFTGTGGALFVTFLVGYLLTIITLGIYTPWFITKLLKFHMDNTTGTTPEGVEVRLDYGGTGGGLFVTFLVGYLLTIITIGIYTPWFICRINRFILQNTGVLRGGAQVGTADFVGTGGALFVTFLVGYLLTIVTLGIYMPWFMVKLTKFNLGGTRVTLDGVVWTGDFDGKGGDLFVTLLVGYLLTVVTLGIYGAWFTCNMIRFHTDNSVFRSA